MALDVMTQMARSVSIYYAINAALLFVLFSNPKMLKFLMDHPAASARPDRVLIIFLHVLLPAVLFFLISPMVWGPVLRRLARTFKKVSARLAITLLIAMMPRKKKIAVQKALFKRYGPGATFANIKKGMIPGDALRSDKEKTDDA